MKTLTKTVAPTVHPTTGLPVEPVAEFEVGDLVTEAFLSDGRPGVVVAIEGKGKTVYVRPVRFVLGNVTAQSHADYYDDATLVVDPESVEQALALGKTPAEDGRAGGPRKYVLRVAPSAYRADSIHKAETIGPEYHRAKWAIPGSRAGSIQPGARYRRDPHV